jgi:hypothetical protein
LFAEGLYDFVYGAGSGGAKFDHRCEALAALSRKQTRVLTWPVVRSSDSSAAGYTHLSQTERHPRRGPRIGFDFQYRSRPSWETYSSLLEFAGLLRRDLRDLKPLDMIDIQSFILVQGSDVYDE